MQQQADAQSNQKRGAEMYILNILFIKGKTEAETADSAAHAESDVFMKPERKHKKHTLRP